MSANVVQLHAS